MGKNKLFIVSLLLINVLPALAQKRISRASFFKEDGLITLDLSTDLKKIITEKKLNSYQPARVTFHFPDSSVITESISLSARGEFRRKNCFLPTMRLDFKNQASSRLSSLKRLKLVSGCEKGAQYERLVLKEFLVYKIYNLLTDMSFRVRLLRVNYDDTRGKIRSYSQYGFFIEDVDDMAKRNKCQEVEKRAFNTEKTDRRQMTLVAIFQFMIGNTDWAVPNYHNIKLMRPVTDSFSFPYVIPYDFDFCGLVDATYATPHEDLGTSSVRERVYRGFPRTMEEIQATLAIFREKKEDIKKLVMNFELLPSNYRNELMAYLEEFYRLIERKNIVEETFINNARRS